MGDLGLVAKASRSSQSMMRKPDPLTITKVFDTFLLIAKVHSCHYFSENHQCNFECEFCLILLGVN